MSAQVFLDKGPPIGSWIQFTERGSDEYFLIDSTETRQAFHVDPSKKWYVYKYECTPVFIKEVFKVNRFAFLINLSYEVIRCDVRDLSLDPKSRTLRFKEVERPIPSQSKIENFNTMIKKCCQGLSPKTLMQFSFREAINDVREDILVEMLRSARLHQNQPIDSNPIEQAPQTDSSYTILIWAAENNLICLVEVLLSFEILSLNSHKENGETALMVAASKGHITIVSKLLEDKRTDLNLMDSEGKTAFFKAAAAGHLEVVEAFLKVTRQVFIQPEEGRTPLMEAIENGHIQVACLILDKVRSLEKLQHRDKEGNTVFSLIKPGMTELNKRYQEKLKELEEQDKYQEITEEELQEILD